ncbi:serine/threonine protein kinase [Coemansia sp. RSA 2610]|nr:serine/threonine protein kinase [Coemansia sp. RSA 2610]
MESSAALSDSQEMDELNQLFQNQLLVNQVPRSVWGVLLSQSPDDYKTVLLERTKAPRAGSGAAASSSSSRGTFKFGYFIGRHKSCDIRIQNPHISNRHCLIYRVESVGSDDMASSSSSSRVYLEDTSTNGTYVNGMRVGRDVSVELRDGDKIQLVRYQPAKGMAYFNDSFYVFQNLDLHRREPCLFKQSYLDGEELGKGAFAKVIEVTNRVTGERYAAKIIDRNRITQIDKRKKLDENFRVETSILSRVRHPAIVQIHGVFREADYLYLVLDLAKDGELFQEIVNREFLTEDDSRKVLLQLLLAIRHLHRMGIVHRDIKLENILLSDRKTLRLKLADFGLAKIVGEQMFMKTVCGTPMYVAPEVLTVRQVGMYDNLVDMWSLGVVLYICLCGFPPFSEEMSPPPMRDQIISGMYNFPPPYWDSISPEAIDLVTCMMQVDPKNRITVDQALAHPWLKARCTGGGWTIDGLDFVVADPDTAEYCQRTQSVSAESSQLNSAGRGSRGALSPLSPGLHQHRFQPPPRQPQNLPLPPSSPPFTAAAAAGNAQDSEIVLVMASTSDADPRSGDHTTAIGVSTSAEAAGVGGSNGNSRKRKDPSFMRSQSDLGDMALPKRAMRDALQPEQPQFGGSLKQSHGSPNSSPGHISDNSGPLALFEMSPDMNYPPVHGSKPNNGSSSSGNSGGGGNFLQRPRDGGGQKPCPLLIYPKPLPRPGAAAMELPNCHVPPASAKHFRANDGASVTKQPPPPTHKPLPTFFDFTRRA